MNFNELKEGERFFKLDFITMYDYFIVGERSNKLLS